MPSPLYITLLNACQTPPDKGGIATYTQEIADHLARKGHSIALLTYPLREASDPVSGLYVTRRTPWFDLRELVRKGGSRAYLASHLPFKILGMARETARTLHHPEAPGRGRILWAVTWWPEGLVAHLLARAYRIPYVVTAHGYEAIVPPSARRHFLYRRIMNGADRIFAVSRSTASRLVECGLDPRRTRVIHNGIRIEPFALNAHTERLVETTRRKLGLEGCFVLLTVSRLIPRKGHRTVLEAVARLVGRVPRLRYVITGTGPLEQDLRRAVQDLGVQGAVIFTGEVSDPERVALLHACDIFVMPNQDILRPDGVLDTEGFGIAFLEASACGKPVIAGRAGGAPEAVVHGRTGILVEPSNPDELADAVYRLWTDHSLAQRLGREGKRRVEDGFTWELLAERYERELATILPSSRTHKAPTM